MKQSSIRVIPDVPFLSIKGQYLVLLAQLQTIQRIPVSAKCAAALLSLFEHRHNSVVEIIEGGDGDISMLVQRWSVAGIRKYMLNSFSENTIKAAKDALVAWGCIRQEQFFVGNVAQKNGYELQTKFINSQLSLIGEWSITDEVMSAARGNEQAVTNLIENNLLGWVKIAPPMPNDEGGVGQNCPTGGSKLTNINNRINDIDSLTNVSECAPEKKQTEIEAMVPSSEPGEQVPLVQQNPPQSPPESDDAGNGRADAPAEGRKSRDKAKNKHSKQAAHTFEQSILHWEKGNKEDFLSKVALLEDYYKDSPYNDCDFAMLLIKMRDYYTNNGKGVRTKYKEWLVVPRGSWFNDGKQYPIKPKTPPPSERKAPIVFSNIPKLFS